MMWLILAFVFCWACAKVAKSKGRDPLVWGILGFLFAFIPLIILLVIDNNGGQQC